jgi:type III secretion protein T
MLNSYHQHAHSAVPEKTFMEIPTSLYLEMRVWFVAFLLSYARPLTMLMFLPLFSWTRITGLVRIGFAVALTLPIAVTTHTQVVNMANIDFPLMVASVVKEIGLGLILGFMLGLPFHAVQAAGDWIDVTRGASNANIFDPLRSEEASELGTLFMAGSIALFVAAGGILVVIDILYSSYTIWPAVSLFPDLSPEMALNLKSKFDTMFKLAILIASPLVLMLVIVDITLIFASRTSKPLNIYDLSQTFKNLLIVFIIPVYMTFFGFYFETEAWRIFNEILRLLGQRP